MYKFQRLTMKIMIFSLIFIVACGKKNKINNEEIKIDYEVKGGVPEKILIYSKNNLEFGIDEILKGQSHIFSQGISLSSLNKIKESDKNKLNIYETKSGIWSFLLNPVPNAAPYQVKNGNIIEFNPFAIRELRFALNLLIDRDFISKELFQGAGGANISSIIEGTPNAWMFEFQANNLGIDSKGNKEKALRDINNAMENASKLPENKNRLMKKNGFWYFDDKIITVKLAMDNTYSENKVKLLEYLLDLLQEAGIKGQKLSAEDSFVYEKNPSQLSWHIYTEKIKAKDLEYWQDKNILTYNTSLYGNFPGWREDSWWNYKNLEADRLGEKFLQGKIENTDEYWQELMKINEISLKEAIRIYSNYENLYFISNRGAFTRSLYFTPYEGLSRNALENAYVSKNELKVTSFIESKLSSWNPLTKRDDLDNFSKNIIELVFDKDVIQKPFGILKEKRISVVSSQADPNFDKEGDSVKVTGEISIDKDANFYKDYLTAPLKTQFRINYGFWHHGREITKIDYIYKENFEKDFLNIYNRNLIASKWDEDILTYWYSGFSPKGRLESVVDMGIPSLNLNFIYSLPWELVEGIKKLILEGASSGRKYSIIKKEGLNEIDLKSEEFLKDLEEKIKELSNLSYVPNILRNYLTVQEAKESYEKVLNFISSYKHALIGNGPYMLSKFDSEKVYGELIAVRDKAYTEEKGKWAKLFRTSRLVIDEIELPKTVRTGESIKIKIKATEHTYPENIIKKSISGGIYLLFVNEITNLRVDGINTGEGEFEIFLDSESTKSLFGKYKLIAIGTINGQYYYTKISEIVFE